MLEFLIHLDTALFVFINSTLANPVTDLIMPIVTSDDLLRILYGLAMLLVLWKGDARLRWLVLFSLITIALCDQTSSNFLKHTIERIRPCRALEQVHLLVGCGGGYSMPSSHAANAFGQAMLFGVLYGRVRWYLIAFASLVAISRVFVGVHYPFDILVGAMVGSALALIVILAFRLFTKRYIRNSQPKTED